APRCAEADPTQLSDDLVADPLERLGVVLDTPVGHQELPRLDGPLGRLQVVKDVALNGGRPWLGYLTADAGKFATGVGAGGAMAEAVPRSERMNPELVMVALKFLPLLIGRPIGSVRTETFTCNCSSLGSLRLPLGRRTTVSAEAL